MLAELLPTNLFAFFLVFARVGTALMLLPGFGEAYVAPRIRLLLGLAIAAVLTPVLADKLPALPGTPLGLLVLLGGEILVGFFIGALARIMLAALSTAGSIIAYQTSLANALVFDIAASQQGALLASFMSALGVLLIFVSNLHLVALRALVDSYALLPAGALPIMGDMTELIARAVSKSFLLAVQLSAPLLVLGLVFQLGIGLLSRLMPQVQVFFVAQPLQIGLGLLVLALTISVGMILFLDRFGAAVRPLLGG
jgi:flagellar biosynthesis protein FliR